MARWIETIAITRTYANFSMEHIEPCSADNCHRAVIVNDEMSTFNDERQNAGVNNSLKNIAERVPSSIKHLRITRLGI